jgi:DinB superfamily
MRTYISILIVTIFSFNVIDAQHKMEEKLPYYEIPEYSETYTAGTVAARMLDGLGFRYYWATEGLRDEDLNFKPSEDGRTTAETIGHIYGLTKVIVNSTLNKPNTRDEEPYMTYAEKRKKTLENIKMAADILRSSKDISKFMTIFGNNKYPFWNQINGPIADAIWHCGQVISFRRSSGNPYNSKASVFSGKVRQ